jgi:uncharacterized protein (TIGR02118 family)
MHKLVILIEDSEEWQSGETEWPEFLHLAERMPGLRREAISRVEHSLFGGNFVQMHELFFDSLEDVERALTSPDGRSAGRLLQKMTGGHVALFFADHKEDDLVNIHKFRHPEERTA